MATPTGSYYIDVAGTIQQQTNPILAAGLRAAGFKGPFATIADAKAALPGGKDLAGLATGVAKGAVNALNPLNDVASITGISGTNLVIRTLKVIIGSTLLLVGIVHLAGIDSGSIATIARKVPIPV